MQTRRSLLSHASLRGWAALLALSWACTGDERGDGASGDIASEVGAGTAGGTGSGFDNSAGTPTGLRDGNLTGDNEQPSGPLRAFSDCSGEARCEDGLACRYDKCIPDPAPCEDGDDCTQDSYCDQGECIPFGVPEGVDRDESCRANVTLDALVPAVQCRWEGPPAGDPASLSVQVMATPVAVDFDYDDDPGTLHPSIVFTTWGPGNYTEPGVLRVVDGRDCSHQFTLSTDAMAPASAAVGDLDGDGRAEIVVAKSLGGVMAYRYDTAAQQFAVLFTSADAAGGVDKWNGPAIHDLDDDGIAEILYGGMVYDNAGNVLSSSMGVPTGGDFSSVLRGYISVVADVDEDGRMELVQGNAIHEWNPNTHDWVAEPYFDATGLSGGQVAVADFGDYPIAALGQDVAEIVVIENGVARVQRVDGSVIKTMAIPGIGRGGPPTVADFDGDGRAEFASANGTRYAVFDLDCTGPSASCEADGVLWSQPSQDATSNVTGSSVFDFDSDGAAEVVYADECFLRIYAGATGVVRYSAARSSGTTYENPVILDVDGDFNTEIVSSVHDYGGCPATDPLFPTASFESKHGIVVLRDEKDRWAASRPVWNQHPYAVTHVGDRGETPKTSAVKRNWREASLNNFRQNVQGTLEVDGKQDLTVSGHATAIECEGTIARLEAEICNRGTKPMASGTDVSFRQGDESGPELCAIPIAKILDVAQCTRIACEADLASQKIDMTVVVDPGEETSECWEGNNLGFFSDVECGEVPVPELPVLY